MEVLEAIKARRSIRRYKADPVDDKTIELVLEAARLAPSWGNTQCCRFIIVRDHNVKSQLADTLLQVEGREAPAPNPAIDAIRNAPVVIVACAELKRAGFYFGKPATDKGEHWFMFDVALAMQNLVLAAHSLGLGTVMVGAADAGKIGGILNVPAGFVQ
ncbi:MAG: nitroreductase family protein [Chloroflexota bacterium]